MYRVRRENKTEWGHLRVSCTTFTERSRLFMLGLLLPFQCRNCSFPKFCAYMDGTAEKSNYEQYLFTTHMDFMLK